MQTIASKLSLSPLFYKASALTQIHLPLFQIVKFLLHSLEQLHTSYCYSIQFEKNLLANWGDNKHASPSILGKALHAVVALLL